MIYDAFLKRVEEQPDRPALYVWDQQWRCMTYRTLKQRAMSVADALKKHGIRPAEPVAICLDRHETQAVAALGILLAGGAYVPCGLHLPRQRRAAILDKLACRFVIGCPGAAVVSGHSLIYLDPETLPSVGCDPAGRCPSGAAGGHGNPEQTAYVIFTSGSTGEPKGVMISHAGAWGTIADVNSRFGVTSADLDIGISQFDFDLSVYDLFGMLSAGGSLAVLPHHRARDPYFWKETLKQLPVTLWNSVPALLDMLLSVWTEEDGQLPLQKIFLSGDWVYPSFCSRIRQLAGDACLVAMGGATEASIWSNYFKVDEIDEQWASVPYGYPLSGQYLRIVDDTDRPCDIGVAGHLLIGGRGVAIGYWGDETRTARQFFEQDGQRWYRTGDRACLHQDRYVVFLGRSDQQLKLNGYRVEPGEIERTIEQVAGVEQGHILAVRRLGGIELHGFYKMASGAAAQPLTAPTCDIPVGKRDSGQDATAAALIKMLLLEWDRQAADGPHEDVIHSWRNFLCAYGESSAPVDKELLAASDILKPVYLDILSGRRPVVELLNQPLLNLGALMLRDRYTLEALSAVRRRVRQLAQYHSGEAPLQVVFMAPIEPQLLPVLLSDWPSNATMCLIAAHRAAYSALQDMLESCGAATAVRLLPRFAPWVEDCDVAAFDLAVSIHGFHRGVRPEDSPLLAACLLKPEGRLLFAEQDDLPAMGLLTALFLENGFRDILGRPGAGNPMLPGLQWATVLQAAGYNEIHIQHMSGSQVFVAESCLQKACPAIPSHAVQEKLSEQLPAYMIPRSLHLLPFYRYGANQKIDWSACRRALEMVDDAGDQPPQGKTETEIAAIWQRLLQTERVGRQASFFKMGGDSLIAMRFLGELTRHYGIRPDINTFFSAPTVEAIAAYVDQTLLEEKGHQIEEGEI